MHTARGATKAIKLVKPAADVQDGSGDDGAGRDDSVVVAVVDDEGDPDAPKMKTAEEVK